ncbi:hypothetical protein ACIRLA_00935 [Streptomyces sp. NPDC102364]
MTSTSLSARPTRADTECATATDGWKRRAPLHPCLFIGTPP